MNTHNKSERNALIQRAKRRVDVLNLVNEALDDDPDFIVELRGFIGSASSTNGRPTKRIQLNDHGRTTNYDRIAHQYSKNNNNWMTIKEIIEATGVAAGSIRDAIYKSSSHKFERRNQPGHGLIKQFRLRLLDRELLLPEMKG